MCEVCEQNIDEADDRELLLISLAIIGGLVDNYVEDGYCDPMMYKAVKLAERIAQKLEIPEVVEKFSFLKIQAGTIVEETIEREGMNIKREDWS
jgi:hypothetical protein